MSYTFVAGGTGFIGRELVDAASRAGLELCVLTRDPAAARELDAQGVGTVVGDLAQPGHWQDAAAAAGAAIYVAAPPTWGRRLSQRVARRYREGMTAMTRSFYASLDADRVEKVVYVAGASYYGDTGEHVATEEQTPHPKGTGPYIAPAIDVARAYGQRGIPTVVTFPGAVYGPASWLPQLVLEPLHRGKPIHALRGHEPAISLVHRSDCAEALIHLLHHGSPGESYFIADDEPMTLQAILDLSSELTGIPYKKRPLPQWLCRLAIGPILTDAATGNVVVANAKLKCTGFTLRYPSLRDGLEEVIADWRQANGAPVRRGQR